LRRADHQSKESCRPSKKYYETEVEAKAQQSAVDPLKDGWMNEYSSHSVLFVRLYAFTSYNNITLLLNDQEISKPSNLAM
jgi:hypothetical protein